MEIFNINDGNNVQIFIQVLHVIYQMKYFITIKAIQKLLSESGCELIEMYEECGGIFSKF